MLDWRPVVHGLEVMFLDSHDHDLFHKAVTHHELLGGSRNVAIVVQDTQTRVTRNVGLQSHLVSHVCLQLGLLVLENTLRVRTAAQRSSKALVTDFVDHFSNKL